MTLERANEIARSPFPIFVEHSQADQATVRRHSVKPLRLSIAHLSAVRGPGARAVVIVQVLCIDPVFSLQDYDRGRRGVRSFNRAQLLSGSGPATIPATWVP
jgi:hypothetical protein